MSKIGKLPIVIKEGVSVTVVDGKVNLTGPKGNATFEIPQGITVEVVDGKIQVGQVESTKELTKSLFGLTRATLANFMKGISTGVEKKLELSGVGYRASTNGSELTLSVGFSHPVKIQAPSGITFAVAENVITVSGIDRALVGLVASRIRSVRKPEPYKGKGIKYEGEHIRKKAGKAAKAVGAK